MKDKNMALRVAGVVFLLVAIMHLLRLLLKVQVSVGDINVRLSLSLVGFVAALLLAIWMFSASKK
jgi:F0F1-type ATP synthase membrane subunit a